MGGAAPRTARAARRFALVACSGDGDRGQARARSYLAACAALGVEPRDAIAVEDSPHGVTAAKRAGLACVAVPHAITAQLDLSHADLVLASLADVTLPTRRDLRRRTAVALELTG